MRSFAKCLLLAFCLKRQLDDEQTFADQLEQQPASASVVHIAQPEPDDDDDDDVVPLPGADLEPDGELAKEALRLEGAASTPAMRGSHSPARLEEISICADVHQSRGARDSPQVASKANQSQCLGGNSERYSGVAIKDEIEVFADCVGCLMCFECCCGCCLANPSHANSRQLPCQDIQLMDLHADKMITITQQPMRGNSAYNPCSGLSLAVRPYSWNCEDDEHYNVDDYETRTPTMWRAWWLKSVSE
ncbi:hypothetical protein KR093_000574 [Drosophila rubida]|uniref:Uncharacterized protein n=1 Tax=Drosophila rubida TaxID=30044 RepID=A0AAD4K9H2_9MUSC|nr:hypothetical protein KR093_000574 [Drosophila rubida]